MVFRIELVRSNNKRKKKFNPGKLQIPWNSFHQVNCSGDQTIQFNLWGKIFSFLICEQIKEFHFILFFGYNSIEKYFNLKNDILQLMNNISISYIYIYISITYFSAIGKIIKICMQYNNQALYPVQSLRCHLLY